MMNKEQGKKAFDAWENTSAAYIEKWMKSPLVLAPVGALLTQAMRLKEAHEKVMTSMWSALGLSTRRDQERTLFALHKLESRLMDLEEKLDKRNGG